MLTMSKFTRFAQTTLPFVESSQKMIEMEKDAELSFEIEGRQIRWQILDSLVLHKRVELEIEDWNALLKAQLASAGIV